MVLRAIIKISTMVDLEFRFLITLVQTANKAVLRNVR
jgi:hypothetical protein